MRFDFIVIVPLLPYPAASSLSLDMGYLFDGFQHPPVDGCSTASCDFGALARGDEHIFFYSAILNQKSVIYFYFYIFFFYFYIFYILLLLSPSDKNFCSIGVILFTSTYIIGPWLILLLFI